MYKVVPYPLYYYSVVSGVFSDGKYFLRFQKLVVRAVVYFRDMVDYG